MGRASRLTMNKLKSTIIIAAGGCATFLGIGFYTGNEKFYRNIVMPSLHYMDPEKAHTLALNLAKLGLVSQSRLEYSPLLKTTLWNLEFPNPLGLAAGFDKNGEAIAGMFKAGFGFVEIGSVTPLPQPGNPLPRIFRLDEDRAVINRCGFNSDGHYAVRNRLIKVLKNKKINGIVGVNLGKNKTSESAIDDYVQGVKVFGDLADYVVINISSPNTPGLRLLQQRQLLENLIDKILNARDHLLKHQPPLLVKISPDLSYEEKQDIAKVIKRKGKHIDGLIVSNTTADRPDSLISCFQNESGGLSGQPLNLLSNRTIRDMFVLTEGKVPIIGVGGVFNGRDAYDKIRAGASLIQLYTALAYEGPPVVKKILRELEELLSADGFSNVQEAVGADHKKNTLKN